MLSRFRNWNYRRKILRACSSCKGDLHVNGPSQVNCKTELGFNVNFNGMIVIGNGKLLIGDNFHSGEGCYIVTENHNYDSGDSVPYDAKNSIEKITIIEDNVWFGVGVIVLPGAHICEGAIIQAGSVVSGEIGPYSIAGGHPAKVFKLRDIGHYNKLKDQGKCC